MVGGGEESRDGEEERRGVLSTHLSLAPTALSPRASSLLYCAADDAVRPISGNEGIEAVAAMEEAREREGEGEGEGEGGKGGGGLDYYARAYGAPPLPPLSFPKPNAPADVLKLDRAGLEAFLTEVYRELAAAYREALTAEERKEKERHGGNAAAVGSAHAACLDALDRAASVLAYVYELSSGAGARISNVLVNSSIATLAVAVAEVKVTAPPSSPASSSSSSRGGDRDRDRDREEERGLGSNKASARLHRCREVCCRALGSLFRHATFIGSELEEDGAVSALASLVSGGGGAQGKTRSVREHEYYRVLYYQHHVALSLSLSLSLSVCVCVSHLHSL